MCRFLAFFDSTIPLILYLSWAHCHHFIVIPKLFLSNVTTESDGSDEPDGDVSIPMTPRTQLKLTALSKQSIFKTTKMETKGMRRTTQSGPKYIYLYDLASFNVLTITSVEKTLSIS